MINREVFWHSLLFTIFVFVSGLFLGFILESSRVNNVESALYNSEINLLDQQIRDGVLGSFKVSCPVAKKELFSFADSIYEEAFKLEEYDAASKFSDALPILHKRYDLLRVLLWTESREFNSKCPESFHTVVYFYEYGAEDSSVKGIQSFYSRLLTEIKDNHQDNVLLIPLASNLNVSSLNVLLDSYKINKVPAILIDEKILITEPPTLEELESYIAE